MQELWYQGKIALESIWFRMVLTQIITQVYKDWPLTYPPNNNIWLVLQFGYLWVGSLLPCIHLYTRPTLVGTLWSWTVSFILHQTNIKTLQQEFGSAILMSSIIYWHATSRCFYELQKEKGCVVMNWSHAVWQLKCFQFCPGCTCFWERMVYTMVRALGRSSLGWRSFHLAISGTHNMLAPF